MIWIMKHPQATIEMLGYIPSFVSDDDPRPAREQLHQNYLPGGGWRSFKGFKMLPSGNLSYPGDPETRLLAEATTRAGETIRFYEHSWVAVVQQDGSYEISRMD